MDYFRTEHDAVKSVYLTLQINTYIYIYLFLLVGTGNKYIKDSTVEHEMYPMMSSLLKTG